MALSRRAFLATGAAAAGSLVIGVQFSQAEETEKKIPWPHASGTDFQPNAFIQVTPDNRVILQIQSLNDLAGRLQNRAVPEGSVQSVDRNCFAESLAFLCRPVLHQFPGGVQRGAVIEQARPKRRQCTELLPRSAIGAAHLYEPFHAHFREDGRQMI